RRGCYVEARRKGAGIFDAHGDSFVRNFGHDATQPVALRDSDLRLPTYLCADLGDRGDRRRFVHRGRKLRIESRTRRLARAGSEADDSDAADQRTEADHSSSHARLTPERLSTTRGTPWLCGLRDASHASTHAPI